MHYPSHRLHGFAAEPFFKIYQKPTKNTGKSKKSLQNVQLLSCLCGKTNSLLTKAVPGKF